MTTCVYCGSEDIPEGSQNCLSHEYETGTLCGGGCYANTHPDINSAFIVDVSDWENIDDDWALVINDRE